MEISVHAGQAFGRGGLHGAVISGLNYLADTPGVWKAGEDALSGMAQGAVSPCARQSDPKGLCKIPDPFAAGVGYPAVRGYQYDGFQSDEGGGNGGFNLGNFGKRLILGFLLGGMSGAAFYGTGKAVSAVRDSVRSGKGSSGFEPVPNQGQGFSNKGYNPKAGERTVNGYVKQNSNPEVVLYTKSAGFNSSRGTAGGQFKRLGAEGHYGMSPHVHQPVRNVAPNGVIYGKTGKTVGVDTLYPTPKDIKQLYEYINNGKYHQ